MTPRLSAYFGAPHWPTVLVTYAIGAAGGILAMVAHLPLPMLLGSLLGVGAASIIGFRPLGRLPQSPQQLRMLFIPVIGVAIGGAARPELMQEAAAWLPSLAILALFIPAVHYAGFRVLVATGRVDRVTALFATAPGGLVETVQMGEEAGADMQMLIMLQFLRLILTIVFIPLFFTWMVGHAVGSAGGASVQGSDMGPGDLAILIFAGVAGAIIGLKLRLPAGHILGPIVLSGAFHIAGLTSAVPPQILVWATQVVIGTSLGVRFGGMPKRRILEALRLSLISVTIMMGGAGLIAWGLADVVDESVPAVFLAFAPGGLVEMGLIALSLKLSILYVTAHHLLRIILAVSVVRIFARRLAR
ncbi:AbrB family transcriptional regulator [Defluviimonas sp. WL0002]|uniref:AbrB family transcriptional regulator n=1 Tax=Albidovulum marisflavi TaxID=2984159 RepID=A0ABT2ZE74_9RHOB|nr:AbrB family transcriptional regulator [Defluviimonas sp. WL0002]MCV2869453.1 AbrB family transcriptional regulator [Defluviimonas sp. WL0002]